MPLRHDHAFMAYLGPDCSRFMKEMPKQVVVYAAKYDYDDLFDEAVPRTIHWSLDDAYTAIGASPYFVAWVSAQDTYTLN